MPAAMGHPQPPWATGSNVGIGSLWEKKE